MKLSSAVGAWKLTGAWLDRNRPALVRSALILAVLTASVFFAPRVALGSHSPALIAVALFVGVALLTVLRWPTLGLVIGMSGGIFLPFSWQGGFNVSQITVAGMLSLLAVDLLISRKKPDWAQSRTMLPLMAFVGGSIVSFCLGQFSWYSFARNAPIAAQLGGLAINILSAGAVLIVAYFVDDIRKLQFLTWSFIILGLIYIVGRLMQQAWADRLYQLGFTTESMFWTWLIALLTGQVVANRRLSRPLRLLLGSMILLTFFVAITQAYAWKSGWFPPLVALATIITIRYWRIARYFAIVELVAVLYVAAVSIELKDYSWSTRLDALFIVLSIATISPILGMGFANYYWYAPLFPIRGYAISFNSHNQYVDIIAQTGVVGLACFFWFFAELGMLGSRLLKTAPEGFAQGYLYGALGGLVGTLVAAYLVDWVLPFAYNIGLSGFRASVIAWLFMGGIVSIEQIVRHGSQP